MAISFWNCEANRPSKFIYNRNWITSWNGYYSFRGVRKRKARKKRKKASPAEPGQELIFSLHQPPLLRTLKPQVLFFPRRVAFSERNMYHKFKFFVLAFCFWQDLTLFEKMSEPKSPLFGSKASKDIIES